MAITLELLDKDIQIESKNIIFNGSSLEENSFNVTLPLNAFNQNEIDFTSPTQTKVKHKCLVNIGTQTLYGYFHIDKYNVKENTVDCTLYPNKQIIEFLSTPVQQLIIDQPAEQFAQWHYENQQPVNIVNTAGVSLLPYGPLSYNVANSMSQLSNNYLPNYSSRFIREYGNGANNNYGISRSYLPFFYNPKITDDEFEEYQTVGVGTFKNYMYHPTIKCSDLVTLINQQYRYNNSVNFNVIEVGNGVDLDWNIICGSSKISPYTKSQWCHWCLGERAATSSTTYNSGRTNPILVELLGSHIITQNSDETSVVFDRDCRIRCEMLHIKCSTSGYYNDARIKLVVMRDNEVVDVLFEKTALAMSGPCSIYWKNIKKIDRYVNPPADFRNTPLNRSITLKAGDRIALIVDCGLGVGLTTHINYLSLMLKWNYEPFSYSITEDDWDIDIPYWSGFQTELQDVDTISGYIKNTEANTRKALRKVFDKTMTELIMDYQYDPDDIKYKWVEPFVANYYGMFMNLGSLTPLQLMSYISVAQGCDLYVGDQGQLIVSKDSFSSPQRVYNAELISIDYLNDNFAQENYIKYGNDISPVGNSNNPNSEIIKTLFETDNTVVKESLVRYPSPTLLWQNSDIFLHLEQDGEIDSDDGVQNNEMGNGFFLDGKEYFDKIFETDIPKYTFRFTVYDLLPPQNIIIINNQRYLILNRKNNIEKQTTDIECVLF